MLKGSVQEYEETCQQIRETSAAVMRYGSAVVAISGSALIIVINAKGSFVDILFFSPAVVFALCLVTQMVHSLTLYKCDSHNRLVAFRNIVSCELLSREVTEGDGHVVLASFDFCMDNLNKVYSEKILDLRLFKELHFANKGIFDGAGEPGEREALIALGFPADITIINMEHDQSEFSEKKYRKVRHLSVWELPILTEEIASWRFPAYINRMVSTIVLIEFLVATALLVKEMFQFGVGVDARIECGPELCAIYSLSAIPVFCGVVVIIILNLRVLDDNRVKYSEIIIGSRTISNYFKQFLPFRLLYISGRFIEAEPYYVGAKWINQLEEARQKRIERI